MAEDNNILDFYPDGEEDSCAEDSYVTLVDDEGNEVESRAQGRKLCHSPAR